MVPWGVVRWIQRIGTIATLISYFQLLFAVVDLSFSKEFSYRTKDNSPRKSPSYLLLIARTT